MSVRIKKLDIESDEKFLKRFVDRLYVRTTVETIQCPCCKGKGFTEREELTDYHKGEYDTFRDDCEYCNKVGAVKRTSKEIKGREDYWKDHGDESLLSSLQNRIAIV